MEGKGLKTFLIIVCIIIAFVFLGPLILKILDAISKNILKIECQRLDKHLLENYYTILQWHNNSYRVLYRDIFAMPKIQPKYALAIDSWWLK